MDVKSVHYPGDPAIEHLVKEYGDCLVCVRYRYDAAKHKRYQTVELVVREETWSEEVRFLHGPEFDAAIKRPVLLDLRPHEIDLVRLVKEHGARWDEEHQRWSLRYDQAVQLGLRQRIIDL